MKMGLTTFVPTFENIYNQIYVYIHVYTLRYFHTSIRVCKPVVTNMTDYLIMRIYGKGASAGDE